MRRPSWPLIAASVLLVLLGVLGTLQYRWLGEVSNAERDRLRAALKTRATDLSQEFDREITRTYLTFHVDTDTLDADPAGVLSDAFARAQKESAAGGIVRDVFVAEGSPEARLQRLDPAARTLSTVEWPDDLRVFRVRTDHERVVVSGPGALPPAFAGDAVAASVPALVVPVSFVRRLPSAGTFKFLPDPATARSIIVRLDAGRLRDALLAPLVERQFGAAATSDYSVRVVSRSDPSRVIFDSSVPPTAPNAPADVSTGLFDLRLEELSRIATGSLNGGVMSFLRKGDGPIAKDRMEITIVRRANGSEEAARGGARVLMNGGEDAGAWRLLIGFKTGTLDTLVAASRRRNLAISLGVLGLLAGSFVLVMVSAERQRRLAQQQMEFVAAVSHELRTPLAVICSAGENLADGVVADGEQIKRYGRLVETEGRRLGDMVERVLAFAGISSGTTTHARADVDVAAVVAAAVGGVRHEALERGVTIESHAGALPPVLGDDDALRSAVQNILANAVKYSESGGRVDVRTDVENGAVVRIQVIDRGLGIDAHDLPHIFKPFYRGRRAVDAQIRGTGIGLSVVRHVVQAHGGDVRLESRVGEGTTVTLDLPITSVTSQGSKLKTVLSSES